MRRSLRWPWLRSDRRTAAQGRAASRTRHRSRLEVDCLENRLVLSGGTSGSVCPYSGDPAHDDASAQQAQAGSQQVTCSMSGGGSYSSGGGSCSGGNSGPGGGSCTYYAATSGQNCASTDDPQGDGGGGAYWYSSGGSNGGGPGVGPGGGMAQAPGVVGVTTATASPTAGRAADGGGFDQAPADLVAGGSGAVATADQPQSGTGTSLGAATLVTADGPVSPSGALDLTRADDAEADEADAGNLFGRLADPGELGGGLEAPAFGYRLEPDIAPAGESSAFVLATLKPVAAERAESPAPRDRVGPPAPLVGQGAQSASHDALAAPPAADTPDAAQPAALDGGEGYISGGIWDEPQQLVPAAAGGLFLLGLGYGRERGERRPQRSRHGLRPIGA